MMGQGSSSRSDSFRASKRKSFMERKGSLLRRPKRELSATFNMYKGDFNVEFLNINTATEEELMTLPGISRPVAHNIVDYRQAIGQFKKVEDLALVSGVGANRLALIRNEICVSSRRRRNSRSSSSGGTHSEDSIGTVTDSQDHSSTTNGGVTNGYDLPEKLYSYKLIDVNGATIFQLMTVRGINQKLAANIVCHREKKGLFKSMDDVGKVKGIGHRKANELRSYLCVNALGDTVSECHKYNMSSGSVRGIPFRRSSSEPVTSTLISDSDITGLGMQDRIGMDEVDNCSDECLDDKTVYEVLSSRCPRPIVANKFHFKRNGQPALRLGSWNLEHFTVEKASNLGVIEVVCRTILENGLSLLAVQDLKDPSAVERLCSELNMPYLNSIKSWVGSTGIWKCHISESISVDGQEPEYLALMYDSSRGVTVVKSETLHFAPSNNNGPTIPGAFFATIKVENIEFSVLSLRLTADNSLSESNVPILAILETWLEKVTETTLLIVLGDFQADPLSKDFGLLSERFDKLVPDAIKSDSCFYQDMWMSLSIQKFYTGYSGIVNKGLCHLTIPKGWSWGGSVSSQSPVWAEFYVPSLMSLSVLTDKADFICEEKSS